MVLLEIIGMTVIATTVIVWSSEFFKYIKKKG